MENNIEKYDHLLDLTIEKYGFQQQMDMLEEECIELALAIHKLKRESYSNEEREKRVKNLYSELADVSIMMAQAKKMIDWTEVEKQIEFKLNRLQQRINQNQK